MFGNLTTENRVFVGKWFQLESSFPANTYLFKVKNGNIMIMCEIC